jgi:hypothetical protein
MHLDVEKRIDYYRRDFEQVLVGHLLCLWP